MKINIQKAREDLVHGNKPTYDYLEATRRIMTVHMPAALDYIEDLERSLIESNHRCLDLQYALDASESRREEIAGKISEMSHILICPECKPPIDFSDAGGLQKKLLKDNFELRNRPEDMK